MAGMFEAIRVFACGHKVHTGKALRFFRTAKGELTECPEGCGMQKTARVESGVAMKVVGFSATDGILCSKLR